MKKDQQDLFEEKNIKKYNKKKNGNENRYFIPIARNNLYAILASGIVIPSSSYYNYEDDLQTACPEKIVITKDGFNFFNLNDLKIETTSSCGVLLEIDINKLNMDEVFEVKNNKLTKKSLDQKTSLFFYGKSISINNIKTIYFQNFEEIDDFKSRIFENVPIEHKNFENDEKLFNIKLSKNNITLLQKLKKDKISQDFSQYQYSDSITCLIATFLHFLPAQKVFFEFYKDFLENIFMHDKFIMPKHIKSKKLDVDLLNITINLLIKSNLSDGWQPKEFLKTIYTEIVNNKYDKSSMSQLKVWFEMSNDIIDNKISAPTLSDDKFIVGRAILLLLMRPRPEDLVSAQSSSLEPGNTVFTIATMFSGARYGFEALPNSYKMQNEYSLEFFQDIKSKIFNKDKNIFKIEDFIITENFKTNSFESTLQIMYQNKMIVTKIDNGPVELNKIMLLAKSRKEPMTLSPEREFNRLAYKYEFDKGKRKQTVYIKTGALTKDGHRTLRFYSPCLDLSVKNNIAVLKNMLWDILLRQNKPERFCRFAIDEESNQFIVMKDEIDHLDISKELGFLKHIAKVADQFEKEFGLDKY